MSVNYNFLETLSGNPVRVKESTLICTYLLNLTIFISFNGLSTTNNTNMFVFAMHGGQGGFHPL